MGTYSDEVEGITTISSEDYFSTVAASRTDAYKKTFGSFSLNIGIGLNDYLSLGWSADIWDLLGMSTDSVGTTALGPIIESEASIPNEKDFSFTIYDWYTVN